MICLSIWFNSTSLTILIDHGHWTYLLQYVLSEILFVTVIPTHRKMLPVTFGWIAFFPSLFFLSISSLEQEDHCIFACCVRDLFLNIFRFTDYNCQPFSVLYSTLFRLVFFSLSCVQTSWWIHPASVLWVTNVILSFLLVSSRDRAIIWNFYLEPNSNIHGFLLIRISKPTIRQQEQNMIK